MTPDPLSDPLPEVVAEYGESASQPAPAPAPPAPSPAPPAPVMPSATVSPEPTSAQRPRTPISTHVPSADIGELRDGLAGMRTDLRLVPEHVSQAISGTVLHAVSVALTEVRRPLEGMTVITEQLSAVLARLEGVAGLKDQIAGLEHLPADLQRNAQELTHELGSLTSDLAALVTRVTGMDERASSSSDTLSSLEASLVGLEERIAAVVREQVVRSVRDQMRDLIRDGVRDGLASQLDEAVTLAVRTGLADAVQEAIGPAVEEVVTQSLNRAIAKSQEALEKRLVLHIDDAVMQLAEVLMRHQVQALKNVMVTAIEESEDGTPLSHEEHAELDQLLTRITPPASLADAVANAVARTTFTTGADDLSSRWRDPSLRTAALQEATEAATAAVEAAASETDSFSAMPPGEPKRRGFFRR